MIAPNKANIRAYAGVGVIYRPENGQGAVILVAVNGADLAQEYRRITGEYLEPFRCSRVVVVNARELEDGR